MKKILLIPLLLFSCHQKEVKSKEQIAQEEAKELINKAAIKFIAEEVGQLNINIATAKNSYSNIYEREKAMNWISANESQFLSGRRITIDSLDTQFFHEQYEKQKNYITLKWRNEVAKVLYKESLQKQMQAEEDLRAAKEQLK